MVEVTAKSFKIKGALEANSINVVGMATLGYILPLFIDYPRNMVEGWAAVRYKDLPAPHLGVVVLGLLIGWEQNTTLPLAIIPLAIMYAFYILIGSRDSFNQKYSCFALATNDDSTSPYSYALFL